MKRFTGLFVLLGMLALPLSASAAGKTGIYVAPKFVYGFTQMNSMKGTWGDEYPALDDFFSLNMGNKNDSAFGGALAIGYDFNKKFQVPVRTELEYATFSEVSGKMRDSDPGSGFLNDDYDISLKQKLQIQTLFVNAYYDFRNDTPFTPYFGAGMGLAFIKTKASVGAEFGLAFISESGSTGSSTSTNFAWNIGTGVAYDINEALSLDLGYRFAGLGEAKTKWARDGDGDPLARSKTGDVYMHQVMLGLRFTF
jgi:opacity protein-like surface antigen